MTTMNLRFAFEKETKGAVRFDGPAAALRDDTALQHRLLAL
jgi:hypothetical protein